jgi:hypothetical protein
MPAAARNLRQVPLGTLLSWAWVAFTIEVDNAFEAEGSGRFGRRFRISLPMWANGLRVIAEEGVTLSHARSAARAHCNLGGLERWGWVKVGTEPWGRRTGFGSSRGITADTVLRPTSAGSEARRLWPAVVARTEENWRRRFGSEVVDALNDAVRGPSDAPWSPPEVHPTDGFFSHIVEGQPSGEGRPLIVRLGQRLTSLTQATEEAIGVSLPLAANFLRVVDTSAVALRELPARAGVSKEAVSMGVNYLERTGLAKVRPQRLVQLAAPGFDALDRYRGHKARGIPAGLRAALVALVSKPDLLAAGLVPPEGCWRGQRPYRAQTDRLLADPLSALPWHPMVLHRGGWPDGS